MLALNFDPYPTLFTQNLILRRITRNDLNELFILRSNPDAMKYIDRPITTSIAMAEELFVKMENLLESNTGIAWGITLKTVDKLIGTIGYHRIELEHYRAEIGYLLEPSHWNKGIMSEALKVILSYGFITMNLHSIEAVINPDNMASRKVLLKQGFVKEAYYKENYFSKGKFLDTEIYSLLEAGFKYK